MIDISNSLNSAKLNSTVAKQKHVEVIQREPQGGQEKKGSSSQSVPLTPVLSKENLGHAESYRESASVHSLETNANDALTAYQSHERESKRDEIRQMLGVDTYA
jgi:hypothetical protein